MSSDPLELFNIDLCGQMAAGAVRDYRDRYGEGPAWAQLAGMLGWGPPSEHGPLIRRLIERGWLRTTTDRFLFVEVPYSLRPGPRYLQAVSDVS